MKCMLSLLMKKTTICNTREKLFQKYCSKLKPKNFNRDYLESLISIRRLNPNVKVQDIIAQVFL